MSKELSSIDKANEFFEASSEFKLVPRFDENQNQIGYALREGEHDIYEFDTLDQESAAARAVAFYDGVTYGHLEVNEWLMALQTMGKREKLKDLKASKITAITKPTIEELNTLLAPHQYRVMPRPEPWEGEVRGYVLEDMSSNEIGWELHTDDEALVAMLVNVLFYGISVGTDVAKGQALRIRALDEWQPPGGKAN